VDIQYEIEYWKSQIIHFVSAANPHFI